MQKRLQIELFDGKYTPTNIQPNTVIPIPNIFIYYLYFAKIKIEIGIHYHFQRPTRVTINDIEYIQFLYHITQCINQNKKRKHIQLGIITENDHDPIYDDFYHCLCCSSILYNWNPSFTFNQLIDEIIQNYEQKMKPVWFIFINVIKRQPYLISDIPIEKYL